MRRVVLLSIISIFVKYCNATIDVRSYIYEVYKSFESHYYTEYKQSLMVFDSTNSPIDSVSTYVKSYRNNFIKIATNKLINIKSDSLFIELDLIDSTIIVHKLKDPMELLNPIKDYLKMIEDQGGRFEILKSYKAILEVGLMLNASSKPILYITIDTMNKFITEQSYYTYLKRNENDILVFCKISYQDLVIDESRKLTFEDFFYVKNNDSKLIFNEKFKKYKIIYR